MSIKDKLDIVLITYNRRYCLQRTLDQIFADNSPIKDFDITILDNASTDGTTEVITEYRKFYPNIRHIINNVNIGGCPNIAKAFIEIPQKEYVWVLCDNDDYDWQKWKEIETAINRRYDTIFTRHCENEPAKMYYAASLVSGCIHKKSLIDSTVAENMYDSISVMFPHLAIIAKVLNDKKLFFIPAKDIVLAGINPEHNSAMTRGVEKENLPESRRKILWSVGYFASTELIKDKKLRSQIIEGTRHFHKSLYDLFKTFMVKNKVLHKNYFYNFHRIFRMLNFTQKIKFILAFLEINLSFKDYRFYEIREKKDWIEYFDKINEQKYLNKMAKKLKDKKVLLYGAGMISEVLLENYDLSKFNIVGISDKRFERSGEREFHGMTAIKPEEITDENADAILFCMKLFTTPEKSLKENGVKSKMYSALKQNSRYAVRS